MGSTNRILPPLIDESTFDVILKSLAKIVGAENVSSDDTTKLEEYNDVYLFDEDREAKPSAAVRPSSVEEVQAIVRLANEFKFPLWTVSLGKNWGFGAASPVVHGSVVLALGRMDKVLEMNEKLGYAIVEPGVSFFKLYEHARSNNLKLWPSVPGLGWGSVMGNSLERGMGYTPNGQHAREVCGMEVILPDGELIRTGMGALGNEKTWPLYPGGFGPDIEGLFSQSGLGIVTKMGIHITPQPQTYITCEVFAPKESDLPALIDIASDLYRRKIVTNHPVVFNPFRRIVANEDPKIQSQIGPLIGKYRGGAIPEADLVAICEKNGMGYWSVVFAFFGPEELVDANWNYVQKVFTAGIPGAGFNSTKAVGKDGALVRQEDIASEHIPMNGVPNLKALKLMDYRGSPGAHSCFGPVLPCSGPEIYEWHLEAKKLTAEAGFDYFADFHLLGRHSISLLLIIFGPHERKQIKNYLDNLLDLTHSFGYSEYRTHTLLMDKVQGHFDYNGGALRKYLTSLKDLTDPNGILQPGKSGIWGTLRAKQNGLIVSGSKKL